MKGKGFEKVGEILKSLFQSRCDFDFNPVEECFSRYFLRKRLKLLEVFRKFEEENKRREKFSF